MILDHLMTGNTKPSIMTSPALGAISAGIRYQVRFFWLQALPMLTRDGIDRVEMEHSEADGIDDVAVFYSAPGKNDGGKMTDADYFQAKYHVDQRGTINAAFFTDATRTGTAKPILKRIADTWTKERVDHPGCRMTFLTTWQWDSSDPLLSCIKENSHLNETFFSAGKKSAVGKIRKQWIATTGLNEADFEAFIKCLRFYVPWPTYEVERSLRDCMQLAGLEAPPLGQERNALDDLGNRFLETRRIKWCRDELQTLLKQEGLLAKEPVVRHPILSIRSFTWLSGLGLQPGDVDIDLTDLFSGRFPHSPSAWSQDIPTRLVQKLPQAVLLNQPIELALDCHLSIAWYTGMLLNSKSGVQTIIRQRSNQRGVELWNPTLGTSAVDEWILEEDRDGSDELVVIASLTHPTKDDVLRSLPNLGLVGARIMHLTHPSPGNSVVRNGEHALALAKSLATRIRDTLSEKPSTKVHLFFSAPVSFAFLFGQNSGVIGPATVYEYDFKGTKTYSPGASSNAV